MTSEYYTLKIATVAGKYPDETGSNTLTFLHTDTPSKIRLRDYSLQMDEDNPKVLRLIFDNANAELTASSYDSTRNTGTLTGGLQVTLTLYSDLTATAVAFFHGQIVTLSQTKGGILEVECESALAKLQRIVSDFYWASSYREDYERLLVYAASPTWPARIDSVDTTWVEPVFKLAICRREDLKLYSNTRTSSVKLDVSGKRYAQPFSGKDGDHINKWHFSVYGAATNTADLRISIQECDAVTGPSGTDICYYDWPNATGLTDAAWFDCSWYPDNDTGHGFTYADRLLPDKQYALVVRPMGSTTVVDIDIGTATEGSVEQAWYYDGATWARLTANFGPFALEWSPWQDLKCDIGYKNAVYTDEIWVDGAGRNDIPDTNAYYERACVSYFYGTVSKKTILEHLINLIFGSTFDNVSSSITDTLPMYRTAGKTPVECLQQICDLEEGGLSNRQLVVYDYWSGGAEYICVRPRLKTSDSSVVTFSDSGTTDEEYRILDYDLKKSVPLKINTVVIIGESASGTPIYASAVDWVSRALFGPVEHRHTDKNLRSFTECQSEAKRWLSAINRTDWEGTITVGGIYPDLMYSPVNPAATTNCGGKIITLNISELGLSATKFKVRSVKVVPGQTILSVTNFDYSKDDETSAKQWKNRLAENFVATSDLIYNYFSRLRYESAVTDAVLYMELQTSGAIAISGQTRVRCIKTMIGSTNVYAATFMPGNGYTTPAGPVGIIKLYDDPVAGTQKASVVLKSCEYFWKLKSTRVMVEVHCDAS